MNRNLTLINHARDSWQNLSSLRAVRRRCVDFTFGRQWNDTHRLSNGRTLSEAARWLERGKTPLCNNLIRQLVKSIAGHWRFRHEQNGGVSEADARMFEEFIISGWAAQRIDPEADEGFVNVAPGRLFFDRFSQPDASDCNFIGMLHDITPAALLRRFGGSDPSRFAEITAIYSDQNQADSRAISSPAPPGLPDTPDFDRVQTPGCYRVIEVWQRGCRPLLRCHDTLIGECAEADGTVENMELLAEENERRAEQNLPPLQWMLDAEEHWEHFFLTPCGHVLESGVADSHPFILSLYPMLDGEVRSVVADVIDQQKYVNSLVMLLDDVLRASAKGIVLFPTDQLPRGMTWKDVREIWSQPGGILPFRRTSKNVMPYQLNSTGASAGAADMLKTQLKLFDEISGTNASSRGSASTARGAEMMARELEQATISIFDIISSFDAFMRRRDARLGCALGGASAPDDTQAAPSLLSR